MSEARETQQVPQAGEAPLGTGEHHEALHEEARPQGPLSPHGFRPSRTPDLPQGERADQALLAGPPLVLRRTSKIPSTFVRFT